VAARAAWEAIAPELEALGLLRIQDGLMFTALCESWATYVAALARVRAEGLTIVNPKTLMEQKNPALTALEVAGRDLLRYTQEFGLTPAAELNLGKPPRPDAGDDDPFGA
jgi:P27 family predicted phage terminase small subunit